MNKGRALFRAVARAAGGGCELTGRTTTTFACVFSARSFRVARVMAGAAKTFLAGALLPQCAWAMAQLAEGAIEFPATPRASVGHALPAESRCPAEPATPLQPASTPSVPPW